MVRCITKWATIIALVMSAASAQAAAPARPADRHAGRKPAVRHPVDAAALSLFLGSWIDRDANNESRLARIVVTRKSAASVNVYVFGYGHCSPALCEWGERVGHIKTGPGAPSIPLEFNFPNTLVYLRITPAAGPMLDAKVEMVVADRAGKHHRYAATARLTLDSVISPLPEAQTISPRQSPSSGTPAPAGKPAIWPAAPASQSEAQAPTPQTQHPVYGAPPSYAAQPPTPLVAPSFPSAARARDNAGEYALGPGEQLRINILGRADITGDYTIDGAGHIQLPLIGQVEAAGRTVEQLRTDITSKLAPRYLVNPGINIQVINTGRSTSPAR